MEAAIVNRVSIPRRVDGRFPQGRKKWTMTARRLMSQSPEGSTADFHRTNRFLSESPRPTIVSIPRRVDGRFPLGSAVTCGGSFALSCLNPPKGRRPISTRRDRLPL